VGRGGAAARRGCVVHVVRKAASVVGNATGVTNLVNCVSHPTLGQCLEAAGKIGLDALAVATDGGSEVVAAAAEEGGSEVLLDTSAVVARAAARGLMKPGECAVICSTVAREAAEKGFSTEGLSVIDDGMSATLRGQVAAQLRAFGANAQGLENDATIGATSLERGIPLITGDRALANAVTKLGGEVRWFAPGG